MRDLPFAEKLAYYVYVIATFGLVWVIKVVIKKAIIESEDL